MESKKGKPPILMTEEVKQKLSKAGLSQSKERSERIMNVKPWCDRWNKQK